MIIVLISSEQVQGVVGALYMIVHALQYCLKPVLSSIDRMAYKSLPAKLQANQAAETPLSTSGQLRRSWTEAFDAVHNELLSRNNTLADLIDVLDYYPQPAVVH